MIMPKHVDSRQEEWQEHEDKITIKNTTNSWCHKLLVSCLEIHSKEVKPALIWICICIAKSNIKYEGIFSNSTLTFSCEIPRGKVLLFFFLGRKISRLLNQINCSISICVYTVCRIGVACGREQKGLQKYTNHRNTNCEKMAKNVGWDGLVSDTVIP